MSGVERKSMGCVPSTSGNYPSSQQMGMGQGDLVEPWKPLRQIETVVQAYVRLDGAITKAETAAPAAHLAALLPLLQNLQQELAKASENSRNPLMSSVENSEASMVEVITNLRLSHDPLLASEHEEFVANINRQTIYSIKQAIMEKEFSDLTDRKNRLEGEVTELQMYYREQDVLLERALGAQYGSQLERELEARLGGARALRDTMSVAASGWAAAVNRTRKAQTCAEQALTSWQLLPHASSLNERVHFGLECLQASLEGTAALQYARSILPSVHFPHCTVRQLQALSLTLEYMFSDMFSQERYNHATRVFNGFAERTLALAAWITETLSTTLQKDLEEIDISILDISNELRTIRVNLMVERGLSDAVYQPPDPKDLMAS